MLGVCVYEQVMSYEPIPPLTKDDLEELLQTKVDRFTISPLTAPGENYGSTMLLVDAILLPDHKKISIAAKLVSESPRMREIFCFRETVTKEICTYMQVRPEFHAIQKEYGVPEELFLDVIPRCYGARTTLGGGIDQPVDESSAILLENLKVSGYRLADRLVGLDLNHLQYVVTRLARFHATAIVIKLKKPDVFKDTVMKAATFVKGGPPSGDPGKNNLADSVTAISHLPVVSQYMDRISKSIERMHDRMKKHERPEGREPFATFVHADFWTNNMMFAYGGSNGEEITGLKIFDFQMPTYGSPATDLLFLLYSSRTIDVSKEDCNMLIKLYHDEFIKWLKLFGCDTEPFSYENFLKEIESEGRDCFTHSLFFIKISSLPESKAPNLLDKSEFDKIFGDINGLGNTYFTKIENLIEEFVERNWL
ncbi:hypothetical protein PR048_031123 [Dryococelus australis]|uniref:CHK kinase-like domain-containing protein n=1 Tax=Dryococelus australis TaxID=614101 RepID=A0ABQ9G4E1_9NEOP|nr:hypothetical protein PR048_031123 [Dryococelus australis]